MAVIDIFLPTMGSLDLEAELLLVPQPATGALLLVGLLALAARSRLRGPALSSKR